MARPGASYRVNEPDVVAESIGGEVLIINLKTGVYYSSEGTGEQIWSLLADGVAVQDVIATISKRFTAADGEIDAAIQTFLEGVERDELLIELPTATTPPIEAAVPDALRPRFQAPLLNRYTDFQQLLLLDPIHEVEEAAGWPAAKPMEQRPGH